MAVRTVKMTPFFLNFYIGLDDATRKKINHSLEIIQIENRPPTEYLKHIVGGGGFFEVRAKVKGKQYRILGYFEEGNWKGDFVVLGGFEKKNNKKGYLEPFIEKAVGEKEEYLKILKEKAREEEEKKQQQEKENEKKKDG